MNNLKLIKKLCSLKTNKLKTILIKYLQSKNYKHIIKNTDYIMAEGSLPICLIAHMDTVFSNSPEEFYFDSQKQVLWSPTGAGFDDRAGIYIIIQIIESGYMPTIIFTDKEESGGIGAHEIIMRYPEYPFAKCKALIQLDRANKEDAVYYDCDNQDFEKYISKFGFRTEFGSFSDISILAPKWKIAAVNLSVGYVSEHTTSELLHYDWCEKTIEKVKNILKNVNSMPFFNYVPFMFNWKDIDVPLYQKCLICESHINYPQEGRFINDTSYPYLICDNCYNLYYKENIDF